MTRATGVFTPPTCTSAISPTRRNLLAQAAAAVAGGALMGAALPLPDAAGAEQPTPDPIFSAIDLHRLAIAQHTAAADIRGNFNDIDMNEEQRSQLKALEAAVDVAWDQLTEAGESLLNTVPSTLSGVMALCRYVEPLLNERDSIDLPEIINRDDDTQSSAAGAFANCIAAGIRAIAAAHLTLAREATT